MGHRFHEPTSSLHPLFVFHSLGHMFLLFLTHIFLLFLAHIFLLFLTHIFLLFLAHIVSSALLLAAMGRIGVWVWDV